MKKYDLTEGSIVKKLLLVAVPIMGTQFIQMTYNLTDMFWLGKLSSDAVAATGSAGMYIWLSMAFMLIGRMGSEIGVSQNLGKKDVKTAKVFSQNAVFLSVVLGVFWALITVFFSKQLISFFNIKEANVASDAALYLAVIGSVTPLTFVNSAITGTFTGSGNAKLPFVSNAIGLGINIVLDPILIFTFDLGILGAAIATVIAQIIVFLIFLYAIKSSTGRPFARYTFFKKPSVKIIKAIIAWSLPIALESLLFCFLSMVITRFITSFGSNALAVQRVGSQIESLSWLIGGGFGSALTAFVGQNYGAGKWSRIHKGFRVSIGIIVVWGFIVTIVLFFGGRFIYSFFLTDSELLDMGKIYMQILATCQIAASLETISAGIFRGIGKTIPPSIVSIIGNAFRVPLCYVLSQTSLGIDGIWWGITLGAMLRGIVIFIWYFIHQSKQPKEDAVSAAVQ